MELDSLHASSKTPPLEEKGMKEVELPSTDKKVKTLSQKIVEQINQSNFDQNLIQKVEKLTIQTPQIESTTNIGKTLLQTNQEESPGVEKSYTHVINDLIKAQELLNESILSKNILPQQLQEMANNLIKIHESLLGDIPGIALLAHQLLDKAAEIWIKTNEIEKAFQARVAATKIPFSASHPLHQLDGSIELSKKQQVDPRFGAHFSGFDSGILKGGNLQFFNRKIQVNETEEEETESETVESADKHCLYFEINPFAREDLKLTTDLLKDPKALEEFKKIAGEVKVTVKNSYTFKGEDPDTKIFSGIDGLSITKSDSIEFEFPGFGKVMFGNTEYWAMYNTIYVEVDKEAKGGEGIKNIQHMLSLLGIGPILRQQKSESDLRMKMNVLFRAFHPEKSYQLEQTKEYFEWPIGKLREKIENSEPKMKETFKKYLEDKPDLMEKVEIYPDKSVWSIKDFGDILREQGAWGFISGITESRKSSCIEKACLILKNGSIATEDRFKAGLFVHGASSIEDLQVGGGKNVFAREALEKLKFALSKMPFKGKVQVLYDLDAINRGGYGYIKDRFGSKLPHVYSTRLSLIALTIKMASVDKMDSDTGIDNEFCMKHRIPPDFIRGFLVPVDFIEDFKTKLRELRLIEKDSEGNEFINGKSMKDFIYTDTLLKSQMWNKGSK